MHPAEIYAREVIARHPIAADSIRLLELHRAELEADGEWPEWCALPMAAVYSGLTTEYGCERLDLTNIHDLAPLTAAWIWMKTKQVFAFDPTLYEALTKQTFDGSIPREALLHLPVPCVYIDNPFVLSSGAHADGYFAWLEYDCHAKWMELRILFVEGEAAASYVCPIKGTLQESFDELTKSSSSRADEALLPKVQDVAKAKQDIVDVFSRTINVLLYLCAESPDYSSKPRQAKPKPVQHGFTPDRPPHKVAVTPVGERVGATIRRSYTENSSTRAVPSGRAHASPVPHVRRAHWHHFWVGARSSDARELILRWIPPVFVRGEESAPTTIRQVKE